MRTVVYAVNEPASAAHRTHLLDQLGRSLESLRAHNGAVRIQIFAFGDMDAHLAPFAEKFRVEVVAKGSYVDSLAKWCPAPHAEVLSHYRVLHKWLALAERPQHPGEQVFYIDNDTFFFDDVARIFERCSTLDFYAREEPFSSRSHAGYRPHYIDEAKLFALAEKEGCRPLPTYNFGAVLLNHAMCERFAVVLPDVLAYVWRFCLAIVRDTDPSDYPLQTQLEYLSSHLPRLATSADLDTALPYPSSNYWIVEQLGLLLGLGRLSQFTHGVFTQQEVIQGVEYHHWPAGDPLPALAHYYSSNTRAFFAWWDKRATSR